MKVRRAHRPGSNLVGASSVTALGGLAAIAAVLPGHGPATPADQAPAALPAQDTSAVAVHDFHVRPMPQRHADAALPLYKVKAGDSISAVAVRKCDGHDKDWTGIYAASRKAHLTARNANVLTIGQQLAIDCRYLPSMAHFAPAPPPPPPPPPVTTQATTASAAAPVSTGHRHHYRSVSNLGGSVQVGGSYEACVIRRESGGQTQVMNASGHYGLYQFDLGTWESGGGSAASFGHASAATQQQVFRSVYAARGTQPWSPSDGC